MANTEKTVFWILVFLLIVGVAAKFYKLEKDVPQAINFSRKSKNEAVKAVKSHAKTPSTLNLNIATAAELEKLPHIGKATAEKIVEYRDAQGPFKEKSDLLRVDGISISRYKLIESRLTAP